MAGVNGPDRLAAVLGELGVIIPEPPRRIPPPMDAASRGVL